jgi:hypothetical protein
MKTLNLDLSTFRRPEYLTAGAEEVAVWLELLAYCAALENGGRIDDAANWPDRLWLRLAGCSADAAQQCRHLLQWQDDGSLVVLFYPAQQEDQLKASRAAGAMAAQQATASTPSTSTPSNARTTKTTQKTATTKQQPPKKENAVATRPTPPQGPDSPKGSTETLSQRRTCCTAEPPAY